uniref:Uncharacterized protein n=1 Tax=Odontella aurita TaxID=265563 RepID=A0A7S4J5L3_9STRA|mmetsp:Transcript_39075/g.117460  ORF Transcript_39075/g.117460 Transcript_39075/m.117460 type:complete len:446 (+) Transcript_39075:987-2324(+)
MIPGRLCRFHSSVKRCLGFFYKLTPLHSRFPLCQFAPYDQNTLESPTGTLGSNAGERGRYATLAAVVGISSKGGNRDGTSTRSNDDAENNFADSFMRFGVDDDMISPFSSTVRLVGVGRAVLRDFFYKTPTLLHPEARLGEAASGGSAEWHVEDEDDEDEWDDGYADSTPIVMAEFTTLRDASTLSYGDSEKLGTKGARSARTSPVHAVAELHRVSNQVGWMHDSRRRLAAGLTAAKARLELRGKRKMWEGEDARAQEEEYEYDDYDGIGLTGSGFSTSVAQWEDDADDIMSVEELLIKFHKQNSNEEEERSEAAASPEIEGRDLPSSLSRVAEMENYGLNYYSYFSSIPDLTSVALNTLEPYYSKEYREKEEHELQVFSFIAFRSLEGYADPMDLAWSLHCQSTIERLHRAYDIMLLHRRELEDIAEKISQELADCGEECTDLW